MVYVASCAFISTGVMWPSAYAMQGLSTVMEWEPARRIAQANVVMFSYLALALVFKRMSERIADERNRAITEHAAALTARLQALQARTNPHFLFNTLNSVMSLIAKQPAQAERMVGRLATLMRYFLEGSDQSYVSLRSELDTVRDYFGIEQVRFGDRLRTAIDVAADIDLELRVPPMVLQPLTENAVLHSVSRRISGGCVRVTVQRGAGDLVELTVTDDGADAGASGHVGTRTSLANLKERLAAGLWRQRRVGHVPGAGRWVLCPGHVARERSTVNVLIVDDEHLAREWIARLLARIPGVQICGEASNGEQALAQATRLEPDVVLLDIHIPGLTGLQVARGLGETPFVFTTAHGRYAIEAFELEACDFLLKPIGFEQLATALQRAARRRVLHELLRKEAAAPAPENPHAGTLVVRERGVVRLIDAQRVTRFHALDKYTSFRLDGEEFFVRDPLDNLEQRLALLGFLRVHRAELVRRNAILGMTSEPGGVASLQLVDGQGVAVSRRYHAATRRALGIGEALR